MSDRDIRYMRLALSLGARGLGRVWPNPAVGCVIVQNRPLDGPQDGPMRGQIVGRGWTQPGGRPHAEVVALAQAGARARGADVYVTLEPCGHHGRTPPCADALVAAGVGRVVVACGDPNREVNGKGLALLRAAGIEVVTGVLQDRARAAHHGFFSRIGNGRPVVTLKLAASLDGRIATQRGESKWITGPAARRLVHAMRARHDAVMVGGGTARADDPSLDVRGLGVAHQPVRVVWSRNLDLPLQGKLARTAGDIPVWIVHGEDADKELVRAWDGLGARLFSCALDGARLIEVGAALRALGDAGLTRVFCEGGGALAASLLGAGVVDELVVFGAGLVIGAEGRPMLGATGVQRLADAARFRLVETRDVGGDVMSRWQGMRG